MTATATAPTTSPATTDTWTAEFQNLKSRFPRAKDSVLFAAHALQQNPAATVDEVKAQAGLHGIRVTAASVSAAQKLLAPVPAATAPTVPSTATDATPARQRTARRGRPAQGDLDPTALIQQVVARVQAQGAAEVERMRVAVQKAIAVLQAAAG